jgi:hypothetical protein
VVAAKYFHNHQERALCVMIRLGYICPSSVSRYNRRLHALTSWLEGMLVLLGELYRSCYYARAAAAWRDQKASPERSRYPVSTGRAWLGPTPKRVSTPCPYPAAGTCWAARSRRSTNRTATHSLCSRPATKCALFRAKGRGWLNPKVGWLRLCKRPVRFGRLHAEKSSSELD